MPEEHRQRYANIYSLVATIEMIEDEYVNGNLDDCPDDYRREMASLRKQLETAQRALGLTQDEVIKFCKAAGLNPIYMINPVDDVPEQPVASNVSVLIGVEFTTLSDMCELNRDGLGTSLAEDFVSKLLKIRGLLNQAGLLDRKPAVRDMTNEWVERFRGMPPRERVPRELTDELASRIQWWIAEVTD